MENDNPVTELFHSNIDVTMQSLETLTDIISECATLMVQCLLSENKILCCGIGQSAALGQIFSSNFLNRFQYERPSLPVINLSCDSSTLTAITQDSGFQDIYANQIRAIGQSGDILFLISDNPSATTIQAIQSAHDREMIVISVGRTDNSNISALMLPEDMELNIPSDNRARIAEAQLLIINCLCELVDQQLFGGY